MAHAQTKIGSLSCVDHYRSGRGCVLLHHHPCHYHTGYHLLAKECSVPEWVISGSLHGNHIDGDVVFFVPQLDKHLAGLVVKASASGAGDLTFDSHLLIRTFPDQVIPVT